MFALLSVTAVTAQTDTKERKAPKEMTPEEMTTRMEKELGLTADQKTKVLALNKQYQDVLRGPGMGRPRGPRPDAQTGATGQQRQRPERPQMTEAQKAEMNKHRAKRQEYDKKLQTILTEKQMKNWRKRQRQGGPGGPRPESRGQ